MRWLRQRGFRDEPVLWLGAAASIFTLFTTMSWVAAVPLAIAAVQRLFVSPVAGSNSGVTPPFET